jgi:protease PrsW
MKMFGHRWFQIFVGGLVLLYLVERVLVATQNPNFIPSVILLEAFLVPVSFVTYLYERLSDWEVPCHPSRSAFCGAGRSARWSPGSWTTICCGIWASSPCSASAWSRRGTKLLLPLVFYFIGRYRSEASGILLGIASAMGFAALETMGYGFVTLLASRGNLALLEEALLARGLASPAGHAAWTGLVCAVLWRERQRAGATVINARIVGAFATAVILHALWDTFNGLRGATFVDWVSIELLSLAVAVVSLVLLA